MKRGAYTILGANLTYMTMAFALMTAGAYFQARSFVSGIFITEYILVLLPVFLLGAAQGVDMKKALRIKRLPLKQTVLIVALACALLPTIAFVNYVAIFFLSLIDKVLIPPIPTATNGGEFALYFFLIAISAGICEEFFFRGMMMNAFEARLNKKWGAVISAILFGVFHFNMQNLFGPIVLGLVFGYIVQLTDSIWAGVVAHTANNGIAVLMGYLSSLGTDAEILAEAQATQLSDSAQLLISLVVIGVIAGLLWIVVLKILEALRQDQKTFEPNSKFRIRGVDYLVLSQYNDSVAVIRVSDVSTENASSKIRHYQMDRLKKLKPKNTMRPWSEPVKGQIPSAHLLPWLGVAVIYMWYVNMHLNYSGF